MLFFIFIMKVSSSHTVWDVSPQMEKHSKRKVELWLPFYKSKLKFKNDNSDEFSIDFYMQT